jgi:transcriptional regulator with XRE-family HTH domain
VEIGKKTIKRFGKRVRDARQSKGWSQEDLAFELQQDRSYISSLERGLRNPTLKTIARIAEALGLTVTELCNGL